MSQQLFTNGSVESSAEVNCSLSNIRAKAASQKKNAQIQPGQRSRQHESYSTYSGVRSKGPNWPRCIQKIKVFLFIYQMRKSHVNCVGVCVWLFGSFYCGQSAFAIREQRRWLRRQLDFPWRCEFLWNSASFLISIWERAHTPVHAGESAGQAGWWER